jgi:hypothetical protein
MTNEFAIIREHMCLTDGQFYYYLIEKEDKPGLYALFEANTPYELECLPKKGD